MPGRWVTTCLRPTEGPVFRPGALGLKPFLLSLPVRSTVYCEPVTAHFFLPTLPLSRQPTVVEASEVGPVPRMHLAFPAAQAPQDGLWLTAQAVPPSSGDGFCDAEDRQP